MADIDKSLDKFAASSMVNLMQTQKLEGFDAPKVSVIVAVLDSYSGLKRTIESIIDQEYASFELVLVVKRMHLRIFEMIKRLHSPLIKVYLIDDTSTFRAYNFGSRFADGEFLVFMNPGNFFLSKHSLKNVFIKVNENAKVVLSKAIYTNEEKKRSVSQGLSDYDMPISHRDVVLSSCFIHTELFRRIGRFNPNMYQSADIDFLAKAINEDQSLFQSLNYVSVDAGYIQQTPVFPLKGIIEKVKTLVKYWGVFSALKFLMRQKILSTLYSTLRSRLKTFFYQGR